VRVRVRGRRASVARAWVCGERGCRWVLEMLTQKIEGFGWMRLFVGIFVRAGLFLVDVA
jgi:hypothetical protein